MRKLCMIAWMLLALCQWSQAARPVAASICVKGVVVDSLTREGEPFANLRVFLPDAAEKPLVMGVTDIDGRFCLSLPRYGTFRLSVTSVGRKPLERVFTAGRGSTEVDLGTLCVTESAEMLQGVEVVAQKPLVKMDIDEISYSVAEDPDAKTTNVLEMLRKVPMVTVDGQDNVKVNSSSSFQIYVNGKPSAMMSANPSQTLKALPASAVKSIEVQTNPGAKYDAEGVGGILNITMEDNSGLEGYSLSLNAMAGNLTQGGGVYAMVQKNKLTLSANVNATHVWAPEMDIEGVREDLLEHTDLEYDSRTSTNMNLVFGNFGATYELDTLNTLSASVSLFGMPQHTYGDGSTWLIRGGQTLFGYDTHTDNRVKSLSVNGSLDYRHTFRDNPAHTLMLAYRVSTQPKKTEAVSLFSIDGSAEDAWAAGLADRYSTDRNNMLEHTFQADYARPLGHGHGIEAGAKYVIRRSCSDNDDTRYRHRSDIAAVYGSYSLRAGAFGLKTGLRYEHTGQRVRFLQGDGEDFDLKYDNWVPSLSASYSFGHGQQLGAGYNLRISRPGIGFLNPYVNDQDPTHITYGNPALRPEKAHNFSLNYSLFSTRFMLNAALRHTLMNNTLEEYTRTEEQVLYTTYGNIGRRRTTELSLFLNWSITSATRLTVNSTTGYVDLRSPSLGYCNHGWQQSLMAGVQHTFPFKLKFSANYFGNTESITLQGKTGGFGMHTLGLSQSFLKGERLNISLTAVNPFCRSVRMDTDVNGNGFTNRTHIRLPMRAFVVGISFRLGDLKPKQKVRTATESDIRDRQATDLPLNGLIPSAEN